MEQHVSSDLFPPGFPSELASAAFVHSKETAWRPSLAATSIKWFAAHGYAVLGTELWLPKHGSIQSLPYFQNVDRKGGETWDAFVARAAIQTSGYFSEFSRNLVEEGDVYVHVNWVSEAEFEKLYL